MDFIQLKDDIRIAKNYIISYMRYLSEHTNQAGSKVNSVIYTTDERTFYVNETVEEIDQLLSTLSKRKKNGQR